jgi:hypothetical protein
LAAGNRTSERQAGDPKATGNRTSERQAGGPQPAGEYGDPDPSKPIRRQAATGTTGWKATNSP